MNPSLSILDKTLQASAPVRDKVTRSFERIRNEVLRSSWVKTSAVSNIIIFLSLPKKADG